MKGLTEPMNFLTYSCNSSLIYFSMRHPSLVNTNTLSHLTLDKHVKELVVGFGGVCAGHDMAEDHLSAASAAVFGYGA